VLRPKATLSLEPGSRNCTPRCSTSCARRGPTAWVVEELWSARSTRFTGVLMGHARGVIALAAGLCEVTFEELSHVTVKRALTGNGAARKDQVKAMVCVQLGLAVAPNG